MTAGGGCTVFALSGITSIVISTFLCCRRDLPLLSPRPSPQSSRLSPLPPRPSPAVISTAGRDLLAVREASSATQDFSLRFEMTAGGGFTVFALAGIRRFLASLRNDMGGRISAFALAGITSIVIAIFLCCLRSLPLLSSRPSPQLPRPSPQSPRPSPQSPRPSPQLPRPSPQSPRPSPLPSRPSPAVISTAGRDLLHGYIPESFITIDRRPSSRGQPPTPRSGRAFPHQQPFRLQAAQIFFHRTPADAEILCQRTAGQRRCIVKQQQYPPLQISNRDMAHAGDWGGDRGGDWGGNLHNLLQFDLEEIASTFTSAVTTFPRCHLDRRERSPLFAWHEKARFLAGARNDKKHARNHTEVGGMSTSVRDDEWTVRDDTMSRGLYAN